MDHVRSPGILHELSPSNHTNYGSLIMRSSRTETLSSCSPPRATITSLLDIVTPQTSHTHSKLAYSQFNEARAASTADSTIKVLPSASSSSTMVNGVYLKQHLMLPSPRGHTPDLNHHVEKHQLRSCMFGTPHHGESHQQHQGDSPISSVIFNMLNRFQYYNVHFAEISLFGPWHTQHHWSGRRGLALRLPIRGPARRLAADGAVCVAERVHAEAADGDGEAVPAAQLRGPDGVPVGLQGLRVGVADHAPLRLRRHAVVPHHPRRRGLVDPGHLGLRHALDAARGGAGRVADRPLADGAAARHQRQ